MRVGKIEIKRRVVVCLIFALAGTSMWWVWSRAKFQRVAITSLPKRPVLRLAKPDVAISDKILREQAEYLDPTPLFFPTKWNFGQGALRENIKRQPGQVFESFPPMFTSGEQDISPKSYNAEIMHLADVVASGNETPFGGIGETDTKPVTLSERNGFLEIRNLHDDKPIIAQPLVGIPIAHSDFAPLEFLVVVSSAGLVTEPVLMNGSGWDDLDAFLRTYLAKTFRVGERLNPGIYRILIGP